MTTTDVRPDRTIRRSAATRRKTVVLLVAVIVGAMAPTGADAETIKQREFRPISPRIMGQGGSHVAIARGYESLFTNPAGIAWTETPELTIPSLTFWAHSRPDLLLPTIGAFGADETLDDQDGDPVLDTLKEQFTTNGFGLGMSLGIGYVGHRIGLGLNIAADSYLYGETFPLGLEGEIQQQMTFTVGYGHPFEIGPVSLAVGGALRPTLRIVSLVDSDTAADLIAQFFDVDVDENGTNGDNGDEPDLFDSITALNGWGVGFDAGLLAQYQSFTFGVQARNLFNTRMEYSRNDLGEIMGALASGGLPSRPTDSDDPAFVAEKYEIPVEYSFGVAWHPDLGETAAIFDPRLHVQVTDPFKLTDQDQDRARSFWTRVHLGTELTFLNFFDWRLGLNQGYFTTGFGVDLAFFNINFALYSQEFGRYPGDQQVGGAALEFAFRF